MAIPSPSIPNITHCCPQKTLGGFSPSVSQLPFLISRYNSILKHYSASLKLHHHCIQSHRVPRSNAVTKRLIYAAASSAAGGSTSNSDSDLNPYEVIGVNPIQGFDKVKAAYARKRKDAERSGDELMLAQLEKAYDKIMFQQLSNRKKGITSAAFKVSKDIKYADKQPIVPWGPRFSKSDVKDLQINMAIAAVFTVWVFIKRSAEYKPLQFLAFAFVYRIFEKLKAAEPDVSSSFNEQGEDEGRMMRMGKRLLRSLSLVFGCIAVASLGYTGILNFFEFTAGFIPVFLYNNQELLVTGSTAVMLHILASYYR